MLLHCSALSLIGKSGATPVSAQAPNMLLPAGAVRTPHVNGGPKLVAVQEAAHVQRSDPVQTLAECPTLHARSFAALPTQ